MGFFVKWSRGVTMTFAHALFALFFLLLAVVVQRLVIKQTYGVDTNYCQFAQGVLFSRGVIHGGGEAFRGLSVHTNCMINPFRTGYAAKYPPGYSALIALALKFGADDLINPICGALTIFMVLGLVHRIYPDGRTAWWVGFLSMVSVYFVHMSAEFWNHPCALLSCTVIAWAVSNHSNFSLSRFLLVICSLVFCFLTRPLSAVGMSLFVVIWGFFIKFRLRASSGLGLVSAALLGIFLGSIALGVYNHLLTGSFALSGYEALHGPNHNPGFHIDPYGRHFTPLEGVKDLVIRYRALDEWLFMWPIPSFLLLGIWAVCLKRWATPDLFFVVWIATQSLIYCFMWSAGQVQFGPRFLYEALPAFIVLSARGVVIVEQFFGSCRLVKIATTIGVTVLGASGFNRYMEYLMH